jgi:hypothetical protein
MIQFTCQAWIGWLISILAVYAACTIFVYVRSNYNDHGTRKILDDMFLYIFGTITAQGTSFINSHKFQMNIFKIISNTSRRILSFTSSFLGCLGHRLVPGCFRICQRVQQHTDVLSSHLLQRT